ncbi:hypothetical protein BKA70DRAFT_1240385 [Coprinopsis sp. MPI-PUGE-AT-0042]|nr:hypothetical protein BKA70DRAFT_1240385 [Coprinopsis sp. MPI-PUGE-AT-0042]
MVNGKEQEKERKPRIVPPDTRLMTLEIQNQPSSEDGDLWAISGQGKEKENERKPRIVPTDTWLRVPGNSKLTILRGWYPWVTEVAHAPTFLTLRWPLVNSTPDHFSHPRIGDPECLGSNVDGLSIPKYIAIRAGLDSPWTAPGQLCFAA